jgi:hypothetical protein
MTGANYELNALSMAHWPQSPYERFDVDSPASRKLDDLTAGPDPCS